MSNTTRTLDLEQLATVTGGTAAETAELKQAILSNPDLAAIWNRKSDRYGFDDAKTAHLVLLEAFGVVYGDFSDTEANVYKIIVDGKERYCVNHAQMVNLCKDYTADL